MNRISYFNQILEENFNKYLKNYFNKLSYCNKTSSFCNYFNFIYDLDNFSDSFIKNIIKGYFEYIDDCFFDSSYRRKNCKSNGFYMFAPKSKHKSLNYLLTYVCSYFAHTVIAESRILNYDGLFVTWYYSDHNYEDYHQVKDSALLFISKIIRHLLPSNFKSIRSYGFYNKSSKICDNIIKVISKEKINFKRSLLKWQNLILTSFKRIPIKCPKCGHLMEFSFEVS